MKLLRLLCVFALLSVWCSSARATSKTRYYVHDHSIVMHEQNDDEFEADEESDDLYHEGMDAIDAAKWQRAVDLFEKVATSKHPRADGALYWKAYAYDKLGRPTEALETIARLRKEFPKSRWLGDARALEVDLRRPAGEKQGVDETDDEEIKLLAINSLMGSDEKRAVGMLEQVLKSSASVRVKEQALFVLSQSESPQSLDIVRRYAKGEGNPDLQMKAIECLGMENNKENLAILETAYASSTDIEVKEAILNAFTIAGAKKQLVDVVSKEKNEKLLEMAIQQLGATGGTAEVWALYGGQTSARVKEAILNALIVGEDHEHLLQVARSDTDGEARITAIHGLGVMGRTKTLVELYKSDKSPESKKAILEGLGMAEATGSIVEIARSESDPELKSSAIQQLGVAGGEDARQALRSMYQQETNRRVREAIVEGMSIAEDATGLIAIAKTEKDRELRLEVVRQLSVMDSKEAKDYLVKLLGVKEDSQ